MGCGVAALVALIGFVAFFLYVQKRPTAITDFLMRQIESSYASDVTEPEKEALRAAYADFSRAVEADRMNERGLERVQSSVGAAARSSRVSREQVRELTEAFRAAAGGSAPPAPTPTAAGPPAS